MKNTNQSIFWAASLMLLTVLACVIPGQAGAPTLAPTVDTSGILSTMVAETVSAAIVLTEQAFPTPTLVPESTSTPTPTIPPTAEIAPAGSTLTVQEDGSTLFVDERAGYEVTVPAGWLAVRIDQQEYRDALTVAPDIQRALAAIQNNDPNVFRLYALDTQDGHVIDGFFTNMEFIWDEQGAVLLNNEDGLKARAEQLTEAAPGLEVLSTKFITTSNNLLVGLMELKTTAKNASDADIVILQRQAVFNSRIGTVSIRLSTVEGLKETAFPIFDALLETIKVSPQ